MRGMTNEHPGLVCGLRGRLEPAPWARERTLEEDAFSLVVKLGPIERRRASRGPGRAGRPAGRQRCGHSARHGAWVPPAARPGLRSGGRRPGVILITRSGEIHIAKGVILGHNTMLLTGRHEFDDGKLLHGPGHVPDEG
jgi:hypothetical protein